MSFDNRGRPWKDEKDISPQPQSNILSMLPRELRDVIWELATPSSEHIVIKAPGKKFCYCKTSCYTAKTQHKCVADMPLPAILNTCHQIRSEATILYYRNNTFRCVIHDHLTMTPIHWLGSLSLEERKAVSKVVIELTVKEKQVEKYEKITEPGRDPSISVSILISIAAARFTQNNGICDRASWQRFADAMWMDLYDFDHRKVEYEVREQRQPYTHWLLEWRDSMEQVKSNVVKRQESKQKRTGIYADDYCKDCDLEVESSWEDADEDEGAREDDASLAVATES